MESRARCRNPHNNKPGQPRDGLLPQAQQGCTGAAAQLPTGWPRWSAPNKQQAPCPAASSATQAAAAHSPQRYHMLRAHSWSSPSVNPTSSIMPNHLGQLRRSSHSAYTSLRGWEGGWGSGRAGQAGQAGTPQLRCTGQAASTRKGCAPLPPPPPHGLGHAGDHLVLQGAVGPVDELKGRVACGSAARGAVQCGQVAVEVHPGADRPGQHGPCRCLPHGGSCSAPPWPSMPSGTSTQS